MASFSIPLTGLEADSTALNTIANDLSNMSTTAFKAQSTNFSDLFYQQVGSTGAGDPIQVGAGVRVASNETDFTAGTPNSTGVASDVALQGSGFFVVDDGSMQYLTRAGNFQTNSTGNLITTNGMKVMGYPAVGGAVDTNSPLAPINIPIGQVQAPQATTTMSIPITLDSASTPGVSSQFPAEVTVFDSLGQAHIATVTYEMTAPGAWTYSAQLPSADYSAAGGDVVPAAIAGTMTFDANGNLATVNGTNVGTGVGDVSAIPLDFTPAGPPASALADGAAGLTISWNLLSSAGTPNISQVDATSAISGTTVQNGYTTGEYEGFAVGSDGTVSVSYNNGNDNVVMGKLALANVANDQGLTMLGNGDYQTTQASGAATIGTSGSGGLGTMEGGALEASNVNISTEFSDLIVAQRAFEANAKSVTTFDTVEQDTINMVH
ncbi:MAG: flagellar hook protein FlgE [Terracidiphilus sp.]